MSDPQRIADRLAYETPQVRRRVLELLDDITAPMHPRQIERALCSAGYTRSQARPIVKALKVLPIIAMGVG